MCTVTILRDEGRLVMTMNRDERRARTGEIAPAQRITDNGKDWYGPLDGAAGGTWVGANQEGVILCLLNYCRAENATPGAQSRGLIIPHLMSLSDGDTILNHLHNGFDCKAYSPFTVAVVTFDAIDTFTYDGGETMTHHRYDQPRLCLTSSSWNTEAVEQWRGEQFETWSAAGESFIGPWPSYNLYQPSECPEWAPLVSRELTSTRSLTQVELTSSAASMRYWVDPEPISDQNNLPAGHKLDWELNTASEPKQSQHLG